MLAGVRVWLGDRRRDGRLALLGRLLWSAERIHYLRGLGFRKPSGVPTTALVKHVKIPDKRGARKYSYETNRLLLEFRYREFTRLAYVRCVKACRTAGDAVRIWHDPDDPADFVTEWGDPSQPESGNPVVWLPGLGGALLLLAAAVVVIRGRMRAAHEPSV